MKDAKAISFTPEVLKAKLRALEEYGRAQTRRPVRTNAPNGRPVERVSALMDDGRAWVEPGGWVKSPFGWKGQRLWVRERARVVHDYPSLRPTADPMAHIRYELDGADIHVRWPRRLRPPVVGNCIPNGVHREGARHFLEVVEVRAERVMDISEQDALLEGVDRDVYEAGGLVPKGYYRAGFFLLYDSIYGAGAHSRDWCWVYTLKRAEP